jgi:hypothetical protein
MSDRHPFVKIFGGGLVGAYLSAQVAFNADSDFSTDVAIVFTFGFTLIAKLIAVALLVRDRIEEQLANGQSVNPVLKWYFCNNRPPMAIGSVIAFVVTLCIVYLL